MKSSLRTKLVIALWVLSAFSTISATALTALLWFRGQRESINEQLQASASALLSLGISDYAELEDFQQLDQFIEDTLQLERVNRVIRIFDKNHRLVFSSVEFDESPIFGVPESNLKKPLLYPIHGKSGAYQCLVIPYEVKNKKGPYFLQILMPLPRPGEIIKNLWWEGLILFSVLFVLSLLVSSLLAKLLLQPVQNIANYLEKMDPKKIELWAPMPQEEEGQYLGAIILGINNLVQRTRASVLQIQRMGRYVAHEMRTPLTVLQGEAENVLSKPQVQKGEYERVLRSSLEEVQKMSEIVSTVLQVGKNQEGLAQSRPEDLDLGKWIENNLGHWEEILSRTIQFRNLLPEASKVHIDTKRLYRLIDNLIRNIRYHTPRETQSRIILAQNNSHLQLSVEDDGPGMSTETLQSLNQNGRHSDAAGVGLNLCFAIAEMEGIYLNFGTVKPHGLRVEISFASPS